MSERWKGYAQSSWDVDVIQNPAAHPFVMAIWFTCAVRFATTSVRARCPISTDCCSWLLIATKRMFGHGSPVLLVNQY